MIVAKKELGSKWTCENCESRFFDLNRDPIICPRCKTPFHPPVLPTRATLVSGQPRRAAAERAPVSTDVSDDAEDGDDLDEQKSSNDQVDSGFDNPDD